MRLYKQCKSLCFSCSGVSVNKKEKHGSLKRKFMSSCLMGINFITYIRNLPFDDKRMRITNS